MKSGSRYTVTLTALWAALSLLLGHSGSAALRSLASTALFAAGIIWMRPLLAIAIALQLPPLIAASMSGSILTAVTLMLTALYLVELGDLLARARGARCYGFARKRASQISFVAALSLAVAAPLAVAAEALSPPLDFGVATLAVAALSALAYVLRNA